MDSVLCHVPIHLLATAGTVCAYTEKDGQAEFAWKTGYLLRWFSCIKQLPISVQTGLDAERDHSS